MAKETLDIKVSKKTEFIEEKEALLEEMIKKFDILKKEYDEEEARIDREIEELEKELDQIEKEEEEVESTQKWGELTKGEESKTIIPESDNEGDTHIKEAILDREVSPIETKLDEITNDIHVTEEQVEEPIENIIEENQNEKIIENTQADIELAKVIEEIPEKDKQLILEEMKENIPMEFEPVGIKKDYKKFIGNQIVKLFSGFKIPNKIKDIINSSATKLLMTTAIITLWTSADSFVKPDGINGSFSSLKKKEVVDSNKEKIMEEMKAVDYETYNQLSENAKNIYLYALERIQDSYVIIDKPNAILYVIGENKKIVLSTPVLLGQTTGEAPNISNPDSDTAEQATTPAGKYTLSKIGVSNVNYIEYEGELFNIVGSDGLGLHETYPGELAKRTAALDSLANRKALGLKAWQLRKIAGKSWGCVNVDKKMWKSIAKCIKEQGTILYITPDNPTLALNPDTGKIKNDNDNLLAINN